MTTKHRVCVLIILSTSILWSQKPISDIKIEGTNLILSAQATSVSVTEFTITPTIDYDKDKLGIELPMKFTITPITELTFLDKVRQHLFEVYEYENTTKQITLYNSDISNIDQNKAQTLTAFIKGNFRKEELDKNFEKDKCTLKDIETFLTTNKSISAKINPISEIITEKLKFRKSFLEKDFFNNIEAYKKYDPNNVNTLADYIKAKDIINERLRGMFNYYNAQLTLIFQYDIEPSAGKLYYNSEIHNVRFFSTKESERYYNKKTREFYKETRKKEKKKIVSHKFSSESKSLVENFKWHSRSDRMKSIKDNLLRDKSKMVYDALKKEFDYLDSHQIQIKNVETQYQYYSIKKEITKLFEEYYNENLKPDREISNWNNRIQELKITLDSILNANEFIKGTSYVLDYPTKENIKEIKKLANLINSEIMKIESIHTLKPPSEIIKNQFAKMEGINKKLDSLINENKLSSDFENNSKNIALILTQADKLSNITKVISKDENIKFEIEEINKITLNLVTFLSKNGINVYYPEKTSIKICFDCVEMVKKNGSLDSNCLSFNNSDPDLESLKVLKLQFEKKQSTTKSNISRLIPQIPLWILKADEINLDINDGFIEHLLVVGHITGIDKGGSTNENNINKRIIKFQKNEPEFISILNRQLKFTNTYPYGFSSSKDFELIKKLPVSVYAGTHKEFEILFEDIIPNYVQSLQNDRLDFSPKDQMVELPVKEKPKGYVNLKKEKSSKILNISVFTDFIGLQANESNGILQMELNKNIPLYTRKFPLRYLRTNFGFANFIEPKLSWSRLESGNDDNNLKLSYQNYFNGAQQDSIPYVTQLDLMRYENVGIGANLNLITWDLSLAKVRIEINFGGKYGRTKVLDTKGKKVLADDDTTNITKTYVINTWNYYPEFKVRIRPDERYGANINYKLMRFNTVTKDFSNINSENSLQNNLKDNPQFHNQIEINAHFSPSAQKDNMFFFRYRYTNNINWEYNGFSEIQIGYSMALKI